MYNRGTKCRKLTFNVVLNEDYEGGDFPVQLGVSQCSNKERVIPETCLEKTGKIIDLPVLLLLQGTASCQGCALQPNRRRHRVHHLGS